jgi:hypothetical protein
MFQDQERMELLEETKEIITDAKVAEK